MTMLDVPHSSSITSAPLTALPDEITTSPGTIPSIITPVWHVAVTRAGMFPMSEARCPCEKAPCGLVIPSLDVECDIHTPSASLHQAHSSADCRSVRASMRAHKHGRRRGLFRRS